MKKVFQLTLPFTKGYLIKELDKIIMSYISIKEEINEKINKRNKKGSYVWDPIGLAFQMYDITFSYRYDIFFNENNKINYSRYNAVIWENNGAYIEI